MRKWISILLVLIMLLCVALPAGAEETVATVSLSLDRQEAVPGETVYLTVSSDKTVSDLIAWQFNICYDTTKFTMGTPQISPDAWPSTVAGLSKGVGEGVFPVSALDVSSGAVSLNAGQIAIIPFTVKADAAFGETTFQIQCDTLTTYQDLTEMQGQVAFENTATLSIVQPETPAHYDGYGAAVSPDDSTTIVGENVTARVWVSDTANAVTTYNTYDLTVTYDLEKLTFVSGKTADDQGNVTENNGTITILGYGKDKTFDTAAVMLTFTAKAVGDADITLSSAKIDLSKNASGQDMPEAAILSSGKITVQAAYAVTLGEGLQAEKQVATAGEDFTFHATDFGNYNYETPVAKCGDTAVSVRDNHDGSYTIAGGDITGPITVTVQRAPKSYTVTVEGSGKDDVEKPATTATYATDYVLTLNKQEGFAYTVAAVSGNQKVTLTEKEKTYTLPGTSITGPVTITAEKTSAGENEVTVTKPTFVSGEAKATKGTDYTFTITRDSGFHYGEPSVTIGGATVEVTEKEDGSYVIPGEKITGNITIEVSREATTQVDISQYLTLQDGNVMWLVTVTGQIPEGHVANYDGNTMYFSEKYDAYAWLLISADSKETLLKQANSAVTLVKGTGTDLCYDGDVNLTGRTDINDAQLVYDLYKTMYCGFETVSMEKFLRADVNGDKMITTQDAAAIVSGLREN